MDDFLKEDRRAEDILLGTLGLGEDAKIISIERTSGGYRGKGLWPDGDEFDFESEDSLDELQEWALKVILAKKH